MILTIAQVIFQLDKKGFTKKEAIVSDFVWIVCFTAIGFYFWVT